MILAMNDYSYSVGRVRCEIQEKGENRDDGS